MFARWFVALLICAALSQQVRAQTVPRKVEVIIYSVNSLNFETGDFYCMVNDWLDKETAQQSFYVDFHRARLLRQSFNVTSNQGLVGKRIPVLFPPTRFRGRPCLGGNDIDDAVSYHLAQYLHGGAYRPPTAEEVYTRAANSLAALTTPSFIDVDTRTLRRAFEPHINDDERVAAGWLEAMQRKVAEASGGKVKLERGPEGRGLALRHGRAHYTVVFNPQYDGGALPLRVLLPNTEQDD